jgi:two-component sensor histidine kinase
MMQRNAHRLLRLINQLLDLSKLEAGAMKLRASRMNIVPLVKGIVYSFETSAGMRSIGLNVVVDQDEIEVYCDKDMVEKILSNLLSNAFKFTPEGGKVVVQISHPKSQIPNHVEISVSDTGIGIPPEQLDKVFDRFYQVDASQTREHEGSGIGLALVKELVELHHGTIQVESEVGVGTTFTVRLPLGRSHLKDEEVVEEPPLGVILSPAQAVDRVRDARLLCKKSRAMSVAMEEYVCESKVLTTAFYQQTPGPSGVESVGRNLPEADITLASGLQAGGKRTPTDMCMNRLTLVGC